MNVNTEINKQRWEVTGWRGHYVIRTTMRNVGVWRGGDLVASHIRWRDTANRIVRLHNLSLNDHPQQLSNPAL